MAAAFEAASGGGGSADFGLSITPGSQTAGTTGSANYTLTLQSLNSFNGSVQLTCDGSTGLPAGAICNQNGQSISSSSPSASLVINMQNVAPGTYNFSVAGMSGALMHSASAQLIASPPGVTGSIALPTSATVAVGGSASFNLTVNSAGGFSGQEQVSLACPSPPAGITCQFNPPSPIMIGPNASQIVGLMVDVNSKPAAVPFAEPTTFRGSRYPLLPFEAGTWIGVVIVLFVITVHFANTSARRPRRIASATFGALGLLLLASLCSCSGGAGGGGGGGGPVTVQVPVRASAGGMNANLGSVSITVP